MENDTKCAFCEINIGRKQAQIIISDYSCLAFLDQRPLFPGHALIIPKTHYSSINDLPPDILSEMINNAKLLAEAMEDGLLAEGAFIALNNKVSQSVPHVHLHVVPRRKGDGLKGFFWPRNPYESPEQMAEIRNTLSASYLKLKSAELKSFTDPRPPTPDP